MEGLRIAVIILAVLSIILWILSYTGTYVAPQIVSTGVPLLFAVLALIYFFTKDRKDY